MLTSFKENFSGTWNFITEIIPDAIGNFIDTLFNFFSGITDFFNDFSLGEMAESLIPDSFKESSIGKSVIGFFTDDEEPSKKIVGEASPEPRRESMAAVAPKEIIVEKEKVVSDKGGSEKAPQVIMPPQQSNPTRTRVVHQIDDMGLNLLNTAMVE